MIKALKSALPCLYSLSSKLQSLFCSSNFRLILHRAGLNGKFGTESMMKNCFSNNAISEIILDIFLKNARDEFSILILMSSLSPRLFPRG